SGASQVAEKEALEALQKNGNDFEAAIQDLRQKIADGRWKQAKNLEGARKSLKSTLESYVPPNDLEQTLGRMLDQIKNDDKAWQKGELNLNVKTEYMKKICNGTNYFNFEFDNDKWRSFMFMGDK
ncbi:MAG: hypothetical protein ACJ76N_18905, partial [Thermoanaerobaculia bacterium]